MSFADDVKEVVTVRIDEEKLADKLFDGPIDKLMLKLVDIIPTEFDNAFYAAKKEELRQHFKELIAEGSDKLEEIVGVDLDGKDEAVSE